MRLSAEVHLRGATRSFASFLFRFARRSILGLLFGFSARAATVAEFQERRLPRKLVHLLVNDTKAPMQPTMDQYIDYLHQVIAMYPAPDPDFYPLYFLPGHETLETDADLHTNQGWGQLSDQVRAIKEQFDLNGLELTVLYPDTSISPATGADATSDVGHGEIAAIFKDAEGFAHELCHRFGLEHAADGNPQVQGDEDPRIPSNETDQLGLDMSRQPPALVRAGSTEIMAYMSGDWPSTFTWQALFDQFTP